MRPRTSWSGTSTGAPADAGAAASAVARTRTSARRAWSQVAARASAGWESVRETAAPVTDVLAPVVRPVTDTVRPTGWWVLVVGALAWWAGRRFGWQELVVLALACASVLVLALVFVVGRSRYAMDLDLAQRRVVVGERAVGRVEVRNTSDRPLLPAEVELPVGAAVATFPLPRLAPGAVHEDLFAIPTQVRSVIPVGPVRSVRGDALGLMRRQVTWTEPVELFVHPRTVGLSGTSAGFVKDLEGRPTRDMSPSDFAFHTLREYSPGDDLRHVHWKTTARTGRIMVRQFEETRRSHLAVALSTTAADYADPDEFELAVSVAGSLGLQALREEKDVTILVHGASLRGKHRGRLLDDLTRLGTRWRRESIVDLARDAAAKVPDASVIVLVFGATVSPTQMRTAAARLPQDIRAVAVQCVPEAVVSMHSIGDLAVLVLGDLADLPRAMRRAAE